MVYRFLHTSLNLRACQHCLRRSIGNSLVASETGRTFHQKQAKNNDLNPAKSRSLIWPRLQILTHDQGFLGSFPPWVATAPVLQHRAENWWNEITHQLHKRRRPAVMVTQNSAHHLGAAAGGWWEDAGGSMLMVMTSES